MRARPIFAGVYGLAIGAIYSVIALAIFAASGEEAFRREGTTVEMAVMLYLVGGALGGALVGVLLPWVTSRPRAAIVGAVAMTPFSVALELTIESGAANVGEWVVSLVTLGTIGASVGWISWNRVRRGAMPSTGP
jgi:hypothetical protein